MDTAALDLNLVPQPIAEGWRPGSWPEFRQWVDQLPSDKARCFYSDGWFLIDMSPVGPLHARDNTLLSAIVLLYAIQKGAIVNGYTNASFQKAGDREAQPDLAFYVGAHGRLPPRDNAIIDLGVYNPPTLVIEISASSLAADLGFKRLLYERLAVQEYWVIDAIQSQVTAFAIDQGRSGEISESQVLPGLAIDLVARALQRSQTESQGETLQWLIQTWQT